MREIIGAVSGGCCGDLVKIEALQGLERAARTWRDDWIVRPLARSRLIEKAIYMDIDIGIKNAGDHVIAFYPNDIVIGRQIRALGTWERAAFEMAVRVVKEQRPDAMGKTFVDVGANIGTQSLYALIAGFRRAVCIEPAPANVRCLRLNTYLNKYSDRITIIEMGAGATRGHLELSLDPINSGGHSVIVPKKQGGGKIQIEVQPVDAILEGLDVRPEDVGLLWVDVEGFEPQVIAGATRLLDASVPVVLEFNPQVYGVAAADELLARLAPHYRAAGVVSQQQISLRPVAEISTRTLPPGQIDLLFI